MQCYQRLALRPPMLHSKRRSSVVVPPLALPPGRTIHGMWPVALTRALYRIVECNFTRTNYPFVHETRLKANVGPTAIKAAQGKRLTYAQQVSE